MTNQCPNCGSSLIGDGFTSPIYCETLDPCLDWEADSGPHYCQFRVIIAGGRLFSDLAALRAYADTMLARKQNVCIISGTARGADTLGEQYATERGFGIKRFPADWVRHGKSAGYKRNVQMAQEAEALIACWDGKSRGTAHMIAEAKRQGLPVRILRY